MGLWVSESLGHVRAGPLFFLLALDWILLGFRLRWMFGLAANFGVVIFLIIFLCVRKIPTEIICTRQKIYNFSCVYQKYRQNIYIFSVKNRNRQYISYFSVGFLIFLSFSSHRQDKVNFFVGFVSTDRDF